ncbi:MAG: DUF1987 domain-containing protein [Defluviitaleaceae bacterium]|nr:DUF1987 domain-containing protein [Defluviitaleaceae bacterium]
MSFYMEKQKTGSTPYILIDESKGYMKMSGKSFPEKALDFFGEVITWLDGYLATDFGEFLFDFAMEYHNSSTLKVITNMLMKMDECAVSGNKITVNWIVAEDDEIMIESGEDIQEDVHNLTFNVVVVDE